MSLVYSRVFIDGKLMLLRGFYAYILAIVFRKLSCILPRLSCKVQKTVFSVSCRLMSIGGVIQATIRDLWAFIL